MSSSGIGQDIHSDVVLPAVPLPNKASLTLQVQGALTNVWRGCCSGMTCLNRASFHLLTVAT